MAGGVKAVPATAQLAREGPLRLLHVIGATAAGGAERMAVELAVGLAGHGVQVGVFALSGRSDEAGERLRSRLAASGIRFFHGPAGPVRLRSLLACRRALGAFDPDVVHLHTPNTELAHALVGFGGAAAVRTIHSVSVNRSAPYRWAYRRNRARSVACSAAVAEANRDWAEPVVVIPNGVNFHWPVQTEEEQRGARQRLGIRDGATAYVTVGGMRGPSLEAAPKAHDVLLHAWQEVWRSLQPADLHLVGSGNRREELEALAAGNPSVHFHGVSADVGDWLLAADVFVMPSRFEGMPVAAIEALGTGLPCIFSDIAPFRELGATHARWVPANDVAALGRALAGGDGFRPAVENPAAFRQRYAMEQVVRRYLDEYRALAGVLA